jgi:glutathione-regulated potassium-efflux system ancillary protein KefF
MNTLCIYAHPRPKQSVVTKSLLESLKSTQPEMITRDLYELYADFFIDVAREQKFLLHAELIIFLFPVHWYSTPSLLKEWMDSVFMPGFSFGVSGHKLSGKYVQILASAGSTQDSYLESGKNKASLKTYFKPLIQSFDFCSMINLEPIFIYNQNYDVKNIASEIKARIEQPNNFLLI